MCTGTRPRGPCPQGHGSRFLVQDVCLVALTDTSSSHTVRTTTTTTTTTTTITTITTTTTRSMLRHERMTVAIALAEFSHHSSRGQMARAGVWGHEQNYTAKIRKPPHPSRSSSASKKSPAGACQHLCLRSLAGRARWCGTSWKISAPSAGSCRFSMLPVLQMVGRRYRHLADPGFPDCRAGYRGAQDLFALRVQRVLLFLSRSQRNSWWKCRPCCLPRASLFRSRSRLSTLQFLVVVVKVLSQDRVQQRRILLADAFLSELWSRSSISQSRLSRRSLTLLLVGALDRGLPHLLVQQMRILLGFFALFPRKKVRSAGQVVSAQQIEHVSSSTLSAHQMARAGEPVDSDGSDVWVLVRPPRNRQVLLLEQTYQLDHQSRAGGCRGRLGCGEAGKRECVVPEPGHWSHCTYTPFSSSWLTGWGVRGLASPRPFLGATRCAVRIVLWFGRQLKFLHVKVPQFPFFDRLLSLPVVLQRRVRAVQTVQKLETPPCSSLSLFTCPLLCVDRCRRWSRQCRKREVSARVLGHGSCPSLCNDRCRTVETVQRTVESPQLVLLLDKAVDVPCWPRHGAVEVP